MFSVSFCSGVVFFFLVVLPIFGRVSLLYLRVVCPNLYDLSVVHLNV